MSIFSMDSKFMQAMSRVADLIILNIVFLVTCLPVFTIGAASAALYSVVFPMGTDEEAGVFRCYFRAFRDNFKQGTALFLILLLPAVLLLASFLVSVTLGGFLHYLSYLYIPLLLLLAFVYSYVFPLISQFSNTVKATLKNALLLSIGYLPRTLVIVALNLLPMVLFYTQTLLFYQTGFLWVLMYFSVAAYLSALLLRKVFAPYQKTEDEEKP